ncbi:MAG: WcaI family glycosyltransferase [Novosphingobium sp.]
MRILIVGLNYAPEPIGIGPYTAGLARFLIDRGHAIEVVAGRPYYPQWRVYDGYRRVAWPTAVEHGVRVVRCPHYVPAHPTGIRRILHHLSFALAALPVALARGARLRPDVVLCITPSLASAGVARLAALAGGSRLWLHVQDLEVDAALSTGLIQPGALSRLMLAVEARLLRIADGVSTISRAMIARLLEKGVAPARAYEMRNWADPGVADADGKAYRSRWGLEGRKVALYAGSLGRKQGAEIILEAARRLTRRSDIAFVICGEGPELAELTESAAGLANVQFHPLQPAERLGELLALADFHLLPQITAASDLVLPSKLTNMLMSGRPVIATAAPGTGLHDEIEGCGLAIPPGDGAALAEAIARLADDPTLARALGSEAARRAAERWSRDAILAGFERRLGALVGPPGRPKLRHG